MPTSAADCPFCEIVQLDDPDVREVFRDEHVVAFFPSEPAVLGHTMLVPRQHFADIWSLPDEIAAQLAKATLRLASAVRAAVDPEGLNIIQSNGQAATQTVFHLHVHLVPRWDGDVMGRIWPDDPTYSEAEMDRVLEAVRSACRVMKK